MKAILLIPFSVDSIPNAIFWSIIAILMLFICISICSWIIRTVRRFHLILFAIIFALIGVLFAIVFNHEIRIIENLEYGFDLLSMEIKAIDQWVTDYVDHLNKNHYEHWIKEDGFIKTMDGYLIETLGKLGINRHQIRMGCFIEGTLIQVDKYGNTVNIEDFRPFDVIYNPILDEQYEIIPIYGNETGFMYQFITQNAFSLTVTEYHAMYITINAEEYELYNIAAKDVDKGNLTLTNNGLQQFIGVKQIFVDEVKVYNLLLLVPEDIPITSRAVVANGIVTFDFSAQQFHEEINK